MHPLLTHEPQNREMALIRCPNCDTLHDLDGALFAGGSRRVRCASCREIWEAVDPESSVAPQFVVPERDSRLQDKPAIESAPSPASAPDTDALDQSAIDSMDFSGAPAEPEKEISQEELEALFAEPTSANSPVASEAQSGGEKGGEPIEFDPASLARAQDAEMARTEGPGSKLEEERKRRRDKRLAATAAHHSGPRKSKGRTSAAVMLMAAGIGTLATFGLMRNETMRLVPETTAVFDAVGLGPNKTQLDIRDVSGKLVAEEARDTLEVVGTITNLSKNVQKIPVLRLSIRNKSGQEIYVWTATADQGELAPGETSQFRRRLASPPAESHSVMVRFVAKDDIVAAIR